MPFCFGVSGKPIHEKAKIHIGRGAKLQAAADQLERELNGGSTCNELRDNITCKADIDSFTASAIRVVPDTLRSYSDYKGAENWPIIIEAESM